MTSRNNAPAEADLNRALVDCHNSEAALREELRLERLRNEVTLAIAEQRKADYDQKVDALRARLQRPAKGAGA